MTRLRRLFLPCAFLASSSFCFGVPQSSTDNSELTFGVQAYKRAKYEEAIEHFQKAVEEDPTDVRAHLYLATAYAQQYIPGVDAPENVQFAERAIGQYKAVLEIDPKNINSVKGIGYLNLQMKKFDEAKESYRRAAELDPLDPEAFYSIAVIDWTQTYQPRQELRAKLNMKPERTLINKPECWELRNKNLDAVAEGIEMLKKAVELRPDYDDAMAYLNLMYRERADIQCGDAKANAADLKTADEWVDKTIAVKKAKAESEQEPQANVKR